MLGPQPRTGLTVPLSRQVEVESLLGAQRAPKGLQDSAHELLVVCGEICCHLLPLLISLHHVCLWASVCTGFAKQLQPGLGSQLRLPLQLPQNLLQRLCTSQGYTPAVSKQTKGRYALSLV